MYLKQKYFRFTIMSKKKIIFKIRQRNNSTHEVGIIIRIWKYCVLWLLPDLVNTVRLACSFILKYKTQYRVYAIHKDNSVVKGPKKEIIDKKCLVF